PERRGARSGGRRRARLSRAPGERPDDGLGRRRRGSARRPGGERHRGAGAHAGPAHGPRRAAAARRRAEGSRRRGRAHRRGDARALAARARAPRRRRRRPAAGPVRDRGQGPRPGDFARAGRAAAPLYGHVLAEAPRSYYGLLALRRIESTPAGPRAAAVTLPADPAEAVADDPGFARVDLLRRLGLVEDALEELADVVEQASGDTVRLYGFSSAYV